MRYHDIGNQSEVRGTNFLEGLSLDNTLLGCWRANQLYIFDSSYKKKVM